MLWAVSYEQQLNPLGVFAISTIFAALPVVVLLWLLAWRRWLPHHAGMAGSFVAVIIAWLIFGMPLVMVGASFFYGAAFGMLPVGWTICNAMLLYNLTVASGHFEIVRKSIAGISDDPRVQAVLIGFAFGAFLEGAAGSGAPVAIAGVLLVGFGFKPLQAAVLCLIANTSPVAYGGLGTPIITLADASGLPAETLSVMAGHQLPILSCIIPLYMVRCMCNWRQTLQVAPVLVVAGGSFAIFQYFAATSHTWVRGLILWPMTDVVGGILSLIVTAGFLKIWHPPPLTEQLDAMTDKPHLCTKPMTTGMVILGWMPFILMSLFLILTGLLRQAESAGKADGIFGPVGVGGFRTNYMIPVPTLDEAVARPKRLQKNPDPNSPNEAERAKFNFCWLTAPGTPVFLAVLTSIVLLRIPRQAVGEAIGVTAKQMTVTLPTIGFMLGLSYITRFSGMDATLGIAFASTGYLYPFFAAILGWLGVFLTGTDAGSNALFGSLQKITATEIHNAGAFESSGLTKDQAQVLICTANSTGGVMGKMIDAQSIVVATSATNQVGREADIFWSVVWHSIILASVVGLMTFAQAYVPILTHMVPRVLP